MGPPGPPRSVWQRAEKTGNGGEQVRDGDANKKRQNKKFKNKETSPQGGEGSRLSILQRSHCSGSAHSRMLAE